MTKSAKLEIEGTLSSDGDPKYPAVYVGSIVFSTLLADTYSGRKVKITVEVVE